MTEMVKFWGFIERTMLMKTSWIICLIWLRNCFSQVSGFNSNKISTWKSNSKPARNALLRLKKLQTTIAKWNDVLFRASLIKKIQPVKERESPRMICVTDVEMVPKYKKKAGLDFEKQFITSNYSEIWRLRKMDLW